MYFLLYIQTRNCFKNDKKGGNILLLIYFDPIQSNPIKPIKTIAHKDLLCNVLLDAGAVKMHAGDSALSQLPIYQESEYIQRKSPLGEENIFNPLFSTRHFSVNLMQKEVRKEMVLRNCWLNRLPNL